MPEFWKRLGAPILFGALVVITVATMVSDREARTTGEQDLPWWQDALFEVAAPLQKLVATPMAAVGSVWSDYLNLVGIREENEELMHRIAELEEENLQFREALVSSAHLESIVAMRDQFEVPMLSSAVVGLDVVPWFHSVLVDRGAGSGVRAGNPVITDQGVVGLITATARNASRVMMLLDRQSAIDVIVQGSRDRGIVRGRGSDQLEFEFVVREAEVSVGDVLITSGLGGVYPKGLRIGEVTEVLDAHGQLMQIARVKPAVDFGRLEHVFVILRRGHGMELLYGEAESVAEASGDGTAPDSEGSESPEEEKGPDAPAESPKHAEARDPASRS